MRKWARKGSRGSVTLELLICLPVLLFLAFFLPHFYMMDSRQGQLQVVLDRYLQEAQLQGGFSLDLWASLEAELSARNLDPQQARFDGSTPVGVRVRRGEAIILNIGYPKGDSLRIVRLVGGQPPDPNEYLWVRGSILSERP